MSKFTVVEFHKSAGKMEGAAFLRHVLAAFPYALHTVLTDKGMAFADLLRNLSQSPAVDAIFGSRIFNRVCKELGIEYRLTKPHLPSTNVQAERTNRTIKDAISKASHHPSLDTLRAQVLAFVSAYDFARHLRALRWRTPFPNVRDAWQRDPSSFRTDLRHPTAGPGIAKLNLLVNRRSVETTKSQCPDRHFDDEQHLRPQGSCLRRV